MSEMGSVSENVLRFLCNYLARFCIAGVVVYCCWIAIINYNYWFSWHVILCTFGYLPLMAESIMLFVGDELWSRQVSRQTKYTIHGILISVGTGMVICGDALVFHYISPGYHLYTWHGYTGLTSMILLIISVVFGLAVNYPDHAKSIVALRPVAFKFLHNLFGVLAFVIGIWSLCLGFYTSWFMYYTREESRTLALVVTIFAAAWALNGALRSGFNQIRSILGV